jgi:hypothetical protein
MKVDLELDAPGGPVRVVIRAGKGARVWGKFVFGRLKSDPAMRALAFDDSAAFHKDVALAHGVQVDGGGWVEFDQTNHRARVGGRSTQFGRERDRGLTVDLLAGALPGYRIEAV